MTDWCVQVWIVLEHDLKCISYQLHIIDRPKYDKIYSSKIEKLILNSLLSVSSTNNKEALQSLAENIANI